MLRDGHSIEAERCRQIDRRQALNRQYAVKSGYGVRGCPKLELDGPCASRV